MLSTTPNIGSAGYPMDRPVRVKNLVHVFHAMVDLSCYRKGSLDFYDTVLMTGPHEEQFIRLVEKARNLEKKALILAGLPCLDDLNRQKNELEIELKKTAEKTVLIAPSWGEKGCFSEYGTDFVKTLAAANYRVIIRLHPHSFIFEPDAVERWAAETKDLDNVIWDDNVFGTQAMAQADILISDVSSIRFDFAFLYRRPVITLPILRQNRSIFESDYMQETWADVMSEKIGVVVNSDRLDVIDQVVEEAIVHFTTKNFGELRGASVVNFGNSAVAIVAYLNQQVELLSMTASERSLKQQIDTLKHEMTDLRQQLSQSEIDGFKDFSK
jgi:cell division protein ZapA (FtsZ GTPase activity inhibitor)